MLKQLRTICAAVCVGILCATVSGCALFGSELDKAAEAAGKLVTFYCDNIPNDAVREQFRTTVNVHAAPNAVNVTCANGSVPLAVPSSTNPTGANAIMPTKNPHEIARVKKRDAEVAKTAAEAAQNASPPVDLSALDSRVSSLESSKSSHDSRISSLESTKSAHESRISSLERRTG